MSEAFLYALDAPDVVDVKAAAKFVDQHMDSAEAPTPRLAAFFDVLMQTWPEDGSNGHVWSSEDFTFNKPDGSVLEMTFELSEFDADKLGTLRALAEQCGLHIFDPEGEILYLADGGEASLYG